MRLCVFLSCLSFKLLRSLISFITLCRWLFDLYISPSNWNLQLLLSTKNL